MYILLPPYDVPMKNILIPTDFTPNSWNAIEYAVYLFDQLPCNFYILHVGDLKQSSVVGNSFSLPAEISSPSIKTKLKNFFERSELLASKKGHHVIALLEYGDFINIIRKTVAEKKIDLIVMGTRGTSGFKKRILGSNTGNVIVKVSCNTLVVPQNAKFKRPGKIAFPTDYNIFYSHTILEALSETIYHCDAQFQILKILKRNGILNAAQENNKAYLEDYLEELYSGSLEFRTFTGTLVLPAIQDATSRGEINMVMMVAKNLNFLQQLFFDSTIKRLSFHNTVPVMMLHEKLIRA